MRLNVDDTLAVNPHHHAEDAVGAGVLRPHVHHQLYAVELRFSGLSGHGQLPLIIVVKGKGLAAGVALESLVEQKGRQIRVSHELHAIEVVPFPLEPVGRWPYGDHGGDLRVVLRRGCLHHHPCGDCSRSRGDRPLPACPHSPPPRDIADSQRQTWNRL